MKVSDSFGSVVASVPTAVRSGRNSRTLLLDRVTAILWTTSVTALLVAVPALLVKTARYSLPFMAEVAVNESVVAVAPLTSENVVPPSVLTCHCTVGDGVPLAAAENVAVLPGWTDWLTGCVVMAGGASTVKV